MINLNRYRIVDLSLKLTPGVLRNGNYVHGKELRRLELREFIYAPDNTYMNWVDTETHIGTHVEGPSHRFREGKDVAVLPLKTFIGEAVVLNFAEKAPGSAILPEDLERGGVKQGDIVLMWCPYRGDDRLYISKAAAEWLLKTGIKMLGIDDSIKVEEEGTMATHDFLLGHDIPIIERLGHLENLKKKRVFFIGFPLRILKMDSSWIRAVALEEK